MDLHPYLHPHLWCHVKTLLTSGPPNKFLLWTSTHTSTRLWWSPVVPYKGVFACGSIYVLTLSRVLSVMLDMLLADVLTDHNLVTELSLFLVGGGTIYLLLPVVNFLVPPLHA